MKLKHYSIAHWPLKCRLKQIRHHISFFLQFFEEWCYLCFKLIFDRHLKAAFQVFYIKYYTVIK